MTSTSTPSTRGFYRRDLDWLRFYPGQLVVGTPTISRLIPNSVELALVAIRRGGDCHEAAISVDNATIHFTFETEMGCIEYEGIVEPDGLTTRVHSHITGYRSEKKYEFISVPGVQLMGREFEKSEELRARIASGDLTERRARVGELLDDPASTLALRERLNLASAANAIAALGPEAAVRAALALGWKQEMDEYRPAPGVKVPTTSKDPAGKAIRAIYKWTKKPSDAGAKSARQLISKVPESARGRLEQVADLMDPSLSATDRSTRLIEHLSTYHSDPRFAIAHIRDRMLPWFLDEFDPWE